jgi:signal transduction histidine kinase
MAIHDAERRGLPERRQPGVARSWSRLEKMTGRAIVTVKDSGPGLTSESFSRLFEPFYTRKPRGMGMGLSICRTIVVDAHGGRIWPKPTPDPAVTVQFAIPAA